MDSELDEEDMHTQALERREAGRLSQHLSGVLVREQGIDRGCRIINFSDRGMFCSFAHLTGNYSDHFDIGEDIEVLINLSGESRRSNYRLPGSVVRTNEEGVGIRFSDSASRFIDEFLDPADELDLGSLGLPEGDDDQPREYSSLLLIAGVVVLLLVLGIAVNQLFERQPEPFQPADHVAPAALEPSPPIAPVSRREPALPAASVAMSAPIVQEEWVLNLASFNEEAAALQFQQRALAAGIAVGSEKALVQGKEVWRLQIVGVTSQEQAQALGEQVKQQLGLSDIWIYKR
jgi:hypothetical protein